MDGLRARVSKRGKARQAAEGSPHAASRNPSSSVRLPRHTTVVYQKQISAPLADGKKKANSSASSPVRKRPSRGSSDVGISGAACVCPLLTRQGASSRETQETQHCCPGECAMWISMTDRLMHSPALPHARAASVGPRQAVPGKCVDSPNSPPLASPSLVCQTPLGRPGRCRKLEFQSNMHFQTGLLPPRRMSDGASTSPPVSATSVGAAVQHLKICRR
ncbi:hypothetical protein BCR34DRAFT_572840 [Clohesyomyces aquaticus]|uniref:Uncharacterized protein n=1 Tax=Clohesyomyces aquaticus TaxID=1231657 RepID=A0A1Y1Z2E6_9PLEO|nr:hypothetical protein BCR34DRAFT_572840 [Clohesyomyces aquaticus]